MTALHVLAPGLHSLIVDQGRSHTRSLGVPVGGAADWTSLTMGNALVGNPPDAAALEISFAGPTLLAHGEVACVLYGAPFDLSRDQVRLQVGTTFTLHDGEHLHIGGTSRGARAYLCVAGGFESRLILGSRSALEPIRTGDVLVCPASRIGARFVRPELLCEEEAPWFRVLAGAQEGWFQASEFYEQEFRVSPASNRMGLRLQGKPLTMPGRELVSEPVCPGAVQVTSDGQCIILGVDGQTIGGYPKIAQVIRADLDRLGQLRPSSPVRFRRVELMEAVNVQRTRQEKLREWLVRLDTTRDFGASRNEELES